MKEKHKLMWIGGFLFIVTIVGAGTMTKPINLFFLSIATMISLFLLIFPDQILENQKRWYKEHKP